MEHLGALQVFVCAAELRSFTAAGQQLGLSASAVSKAILRLEIRLGVKLFHRSTRSISLSPEGVLFLARSQRILGEMAAAEAELAQRQSVPSGRLKMSMPSIGNLFLAKLAAFKQRYPKVILELDCSDRLVDVIEEGFDVVIRTGELSDSRLTVRTLGSYRRVIVGSSAYLQRAGYPTQPEALAEHACLLYRYPNTGKLDVWPLKQNGQLLNVELPLSLICNTLAPQLYFAEHGLGLACLPDIVVQQQLKDGSLQTVLDEFNQDRTTLSMLWPSGSCLSPTLRVFVDEMVEHLWG